MSLYHVRVEQLPWKTQAHFTSSANAHYVSKFELLFYFITSSPRLLFLIPKQVTFFLGLMILLSQ